jgi:hypothetical protein
MNRHTEEITEESERRGSLRFPLQLAVRYQQLGSRHSSWTNSRTLDISSSGLLFATSERLEPGQPLEACISWPVALDNRIPLKLVIKGSVVWSDGRQTAMCFERHEFRTAPAYGAFEY